MSSLKATKRFFTLYKRTRDALRRTDSVGDRSIKATRFKVGSDRFESGIVRSDERIGTDLIATEMQSWARDVMANSNTTVSIFGVPEVSAPSIYCGNHLSYLDIPLLMTQVPLSFVAKAEVGKWPMFGACCRRTGTVLVDRSSGASRRATLAAMLTCLQKDRRSLAIFPSGTTSLREEEEWRFGAFRISERYGIPIKPFRITYNPVRPAAYIDKDWFPTHVWRLLKRSDQLEAKIEFGDAFITEDVRATADRLQRWCLAGHQELLLPPYKSVGSPPQLPIT